MVFHRPFLCRCNQHRWWPKMQVWMLGNLHMSIVAFSFVCVLDYLFAIVFVSLRALTWVVCI